MTLVSRPRQRGQVRDQCRGPEPVAPVDHGTPKSVRACLARAWSIILRKKSNPMERKVLGFWSKSWRCCLTCRRKVAATDFARMRTAILWRPPEELLYAVFTLDKTAMEARGVTKRSAYTYLDRMMATLVQRLRRRFGEVGYVCTIEQHQSGWPHLNVIFHSPGMAAFVAAEGEVKNNHLPPWLKDAADSAGMGTVGWLEKPRGTAEAIAGYLVKVAMQDTLSLSGERQDHLTGELVKLTQLPITAPKGTRRLRSSRGFLPPRFKGNGEWTGAIRKLPQAWAEAEDRAFWASTPEALHPLEQDAQKPQVAPEGAGEACAAGPATGDSGGRGEGREGRQLRLVSIGTSHTVPAVGAPGRRGEGLWDAALPPSRGLDPDQKPALSLQHIAVQP